MKDIIFYFYGYVVFFYSLGLMVSYVILMWLAELGILRSKHSHLSVYPKYIMDNSPYTLGVSIIAPAYNEEKTIVNNVNSLLAQEYPIFEVVIVNDGSRDKTLELLIEHFSLVEVPFAYVEYIHTKPYRRLFKSTRTEYKRLMWWIRKTEERKPMPSMPGLMLPPTRISSIPMWIAFFPKTLFRVVSCRFWNLRT